MTLEKLDELWKIIELCENPSENSPFFKRKSKDFLNEKDKKENVKANSGE